MRQLTAKLAHCFHVLFTQIKYQLLIKNHSFQKSYQLLDTTHIFPIYQIDSWTYLCHHILNNSIYSNLFRLALRFSNNLNYYDCNILEFSIYSPIKDCAIFSAIVIFGISHGAVMQLKVSNSSMNGIKKSVINAKTIAITPMINNMNFIHLWSELPIYHIMENHSKSALNGLFFTGYAYE